MAKKTASQSKLIVNQIVIKAPQRKTSDVEEWRNALKSADTGKINRLFDLYNDLCIDGILSDAMNKRIGAVTNSEITFLSEKSEEVTEITELMDSLYFEELITQIMHVKFWGRAGVEFDFTNGFKVYELPKKHISIEKQVILLDPTSENGIPYADDDHLLILGHKHDFGLFLKTAPFAIWKRGGFGDYAQWLELFGMPQRIGKYSSFDTESRQLLEQAFENAGSAPWLVVPKESEIETVNNTGNGSSGTSFNDFRKACNEEMLITILGQTLTSVQGDKGARSLGEVHKIVEEGKNRSDLRFVQRILNSKVKPILEKRGFPVSNGKFIFPKSATELNVSEIVQLSDILEIPSAFLHEKYSIPSPNNGEPIAKRNGGGVPEPKPEPKPKPGKTKDKSPNDDIENSDRSFLLRLWDFFVSAPELTGAAGNHLTLSDDSFNNKLIGRINGKQTFDTELFEFTSNTLLKALDVTRKTQLADVGFAYGYQSDAFRTAQELNVFHFSAAKTLAEITKLNQQFRESKSFEEFHHKAVKTTDVFNKKWMKTEYNTAVSIAEQTDNYHRLIKKSKLFPYWEYRTAGDDKVRDEHEKLDGMILPANENENHNPNYWEKIFPPNGWNCRCYVVPLLRSDVSNVNFNTMRTRAEEYIKDKQFSKDKAQGFGVNRALTPELFNENQLYIKKFPTRAKKLLKDINYQTYKLGTYEQNRKKAVDKTPLYDGTLDKFLESMPVENNVKYFTDYKHRKIIFDKVKYRKSHKPKKEAQRIPYIKAAKEALSSPDEVWITITETNSFNEYAFVKYYTDKTIVAIGEIKNGKVYCLKTWFKVTENKSTKRYRQGLLIHKKGDE